MKIPLTVSSVSQTTTTNDTGTRATEVVKFAFNASAKDVPQVMVQATSSLTLVIKDPALFGTYKHGQAVTLSLEAD